MAKRLLDLLFSIIELPARYLFGRDVFISYARRDSGEYAPNLVLALQKRKQKISFYLDKWIAPPSGQLPASLRLQLRLSSMLVIVCTPGAVSSTFVRDEIRTFSKRRRKVIVVDVDNSFLQFQKEEDLWAAVGGTSPEKESWDAIRSGQPSDHVLDRILKSVEFTTQDNRLKRAVWGTVAFLLLGIGGAAWYIKYAQAEAEKQREIGVVRRISNESMRLIEQTPDSIIGSTLLAMEAARRSDSIGEHILESDLALRNSLSLLPRLTSKKDFEGEVFSADMKYAVVCVEKKDTTLATIKKIDGDSVVASLPFAGRMQVFGLSNDATRIGIIIRESEGTLFRIMEVKEKRHWDIRLSRENDVFYKVALSPNGKYLLLAYSRESNIRTNTGYVIAMSAEVWSVDEEKSIADLDTKGFLQVHVVAFSPEGTYLAIGGMGRGPRGNDVGRSLVWKTPRGNNWKQDDFTTSDEHVQTNYIDNLAISDDGQLLATYAKHSIFTWKKTYRSYRQETCMPAPRSLAWLAFNSHNQLQTLAKKTKGSQGYVLSQWESSGYYGIIKAPHQYQIDHFAFQGCDSSFMTVSGRYPDEGATFRRWKFGDGSAISSDSAWTGSYSANEVTLPEEPGCEELSKPFYSGDRKFMARIGKVNDDSSLLMIYGLDKTSYVKMSSWKVDATTYISNMLISSSAKRVIVAEHYEPIQIWDLNTKKDIAPASLKSIEKVISCKLSGNEAFLAIESQTPEEPDDDSLFHNVHLWNLKKLDSLKMIHSEERVSAYDFSPGSLYLAVGDKSGHLHIVRTDNLTSKEIQSNYPISSLAFSPDEKYLATGDEGGQVRVTKTVDWNEIIQLMYSGIIHRVLFSCNNEYIAVSTTAEDSMFSDDSEENYMLYVTPLQLKALIAEAERRLKVIRSY